MRRLAVAAAALALAACAAARGPAVDPVLREVALRNPGFEADPRPQERCPLGWGCTAHADPGSFRFVPDEAAPASGRRSLCIERVRKEPWALATTVVSDPSLVGTTLRFSLALRAQELPGPGAGPWILVHGPHGKLAHDQRLVTSTRGWERHAIELVVPSGAQMIEVGATLEGAGRACLDDARLEVLRAPPPPRRPTATP